jgi:hypothetical protein
MMKTMRKMTSGFFLLRMIKYQIMMKSRMNRSRLLMAFGLKSSMALFAPGIRYLKDKKGYEFAFHHLMYRRSGLVCQV